MKSLSKLSVIVFSLILLAGCNSASNSTETISTELSHVEIDEVVVKDVEELDIEVETLMEEESLFYEEIDILEAEGF